MKRLLWIGDAACDSGFARCTHNTLEALRQHYEVSVLGLNYRGDPHKYPYDIYPAWAGGDMFGIGRTDELVRRLRPHVVVIQNDPWNIPVYVQAIDQAKDVPRPVLVGAIAIDGGNCRGWALNGLNHCIFWTKYAQYEALRGGYVGTSGIVPLGVDLDIYKPGDREEALKWIGLPENVCKGFIVGNVNRNQPRKRLDLTIKYFAEWVHERGIDDAYLYLHVAPTGDIGYDINNLVAYHGLHGRVVNADPGVWHGASEETLAKTYRIFDCQVSTSVGEGWGLTTMEGMACGVPQIFPKWSALGEWAALAGMACPCEEVASLNKVNVMGGLVDKSWFIASLQTMYSHPDVRQSYREVGLELVSQPQYRWSNIAEAFTKEVLSAVESADA